MVFRRLLVAAGIGLAMVGGGAVAAADDEVPQPGIVTASATCEQGTAAIKVWVDDDRDIALPVRLDRVKPDQASLTKEATFDEDLLMYFVMFEPVPVGEYNVHVERGGDIRPDDLPVVVKPCADTKPTDDPLRIEVECQAGWGVVTFVVTNPRTKGVVQYNLTNTNLGVHEITDLGAGMFLRITENLFDDKVYSATLTGDGVEVTKEFTVACKEGNPPRLDVGTACADSAGTVMVNVRNPNRVPVDYAVTVKGTTKKVTVPGGEKGTATFAGIATGEHEVLVKGSDKTQAKSTVTVDCGTPPTTTPTTTVPAPQGGTSPQLADTGAAVGGLVWIGALVLALGGVLLMIGRRRAHGN